MKFIHSLFLAFASLSLLTVDATAQAGPVPNITSVNARRAYESTNIVIKGRDLALATQVTFNAVPVPILVARPTRLVVGPIAPQDPGFGTIRVISGHSTDSQPIALLPTLTAIRRGARVTFILDNGDVGTYVVRYSYTPSFGPAFDQSLYGPRYLPLNSGTLAAGVFPDAGPLVLRTVIPVELGQLGNPLQMQALCYAPTPDVTSYTNLTSVPGFGNPMGP